MGEDFQNRLADGANIAGFFQREETNRLLREQQEKQAALPECPYCGVKLPKVGVEICFQCNKDLAWAGHFVCKPKGIASARKKLANWKEAQKKEQALATRQRRVNEAENDVLISVFISVFLVAIFMVLARWALMIFAWMFGLDEGWWLGHAGVIAFVTFMPLTYLLTKVLSPEFDKDHGCGSLVCAIFPAFVLPIYLWTNWQGDITFLGALFILVGWITLGCALVSAYAKVTDA